MKKADVTCKTASESAERRLGGAQQEEMARFLIALAVVATASAGSPIEDRLAALEARLADVERENAALKRQLAETPTPRSASVSPLGTAEERRQLTHIAGDSSTCCRWTPTDSCGTISDATLFEQCTSIHEYLEGKTTTHEVRAPFELGARRNRSSAEL